MKYNNDNLIVSSNITQLEDELWNLKNEINNFKTNLISKFDDLGIAIDEDNSLLEAINTLKKLNNISQSSYGDIYNGTVYDLENETIKKNEIKAVVLVKPGQRIEFTVNHKSYIKPANQFTTGANQFITVDWGDGTATQGYNYFCHTYENIDHDSLKPYNNDYKQAVITIKPTCYLEEEDILMPLSISFVADCQYNVIGLNVNFVGISSEYYTHTYPTISIANYKNLRHYYTTEAYVSSNSFQSCHRLMKIKANKLYLNDTSNYAFQDCWNLISIDADMIVDKAYDTTSRIYMFQDCYNLTTIKKIDLGIVNNEANYAQIFANCFKLKEIPGLIIDCAISKSNTCEFFYNCMSLTNPFQYLINTNMLQYAYRLFAGCHQIVEAPEELDFSLATNTSAMFSRCINMKVPPKRLYIDNSTNCSYMFEHCWLLEESPSILTTSINCSSIIYMFSYCYNLKHINCDLNFPNTVNYQYIFYYCYSLIAFNCNTMRLGNNDKDTGYTHEARNLFTHSWKLKKLPKQEISIRYLELSNDYNRVDIIEYPDELNLIIKNGTTLMKLTSLDNIVKMPTVINIPNNTGTMNLFSGSTGLKEINNLTINIDSATNISSMFQNCYELETINNLTINAPNATNMANFFQNCYNLKTLNNVKINVKPDTAINMSYLFNGCRSLEYLPDIGVPYEQASNLSWAFQYTNIKEAVFNNVFDKITYLPYMFNSCYSLERIKMHIKNDITDYVYWIRESHFLKELDLTFELPNSTRNIFNGVQLGNNLTKLKIDLCNTKYNNNAAFDRSNAKILNEIQLLNWGNTGNITLDTNSQLKKVIITFATGVSANIYLRNGRLSVQALNEFFNNLPKVSGKTLYLKGQTNINECDRSIATSKGWTINTTT